MAFLWRRKNDDDAPKPIRAKTGKKMEMYYDEDKKRWVDPSADPAEEAEADAPPPLPKAKATSAQSANAPKAETKAGSYLDQLIAPPNLHGNFVGNRPKAAQAAAMPNLGGMPPKAPPSAPDGGVAENENEASDAAPPSQAPASNPFAKASPFGGRAVPKMNPNAPRAMRGDGAGPQRPQPKPMQSRASPFGAASPFPGVQPLVAPEAQDKGHEDADGEDPVTTNDKQNRPITPLQTAALEENGDDSVHAGSLPPTPSKISANIPAYQPFVPSSRKTSSHRATDSEAGDDEKNRRVSDPAPASEPHGVDEPGEIHEDGEIAERASETESSKREISRSEDEDETSKDPADSERQTNNDAEDGEIASEVYDLHETIPGLSESGEDSGPQEIGVDSPTPDAEDSDARQELVAAAQSIISDVKDSGPQAHVQDSDAVRIRAATDKELDALPRTPAPSPAAESREDTPGFEAGFPSGGGEDALMNPETEDGEQTSENAVPEPQESTQMAELPTPTVPQDGEDFGLDRRCTDFDPVGDEVAPSPTDDSLVDKDNADVCEAVSEVLSAKSSRKSTMFTVISDKSVNKKETKDTLMNPETEYRKEISENAVPEQQESTGTAELPTTTGPQDDEDLVLDRKCTDFDRVGDEIAPSLTDNSSVDKDNADVVEAVSEILSSTKSSRIGTVISDKSVNKKDSSVRKRSSNNSDGFDFDFDEPAPVFAAKVLTPQDDATKRVGEETTVTNNPAELAWDDFEAEEIAAVPASKDNAPESSPLESARDNLDGDFGQSRSPAPEDTSTVPNQGGHFQDEEPGQLGKPEPEQPVPEELPRQPSAEIVQAVDHVQSAAETDSTTNDQAQTVSAEVASDVAHARSTASKGPEAEHPSQESEAPEIARPVADAWDLDSSPDGWFKDVGETDNFALPTSVPEEPRTEPVIVSAEGNENEEKHGPIETETTEDGGTMNGGVPSDEEKRQTAAEALLAAAVSAARSTPKSQPAAEVEKHVSDLPNAESSPANDSSGSGGLGEPSGSWVVLAEDQQPSGQDVTAAPDTESYPVLEPQKEELANDALEESSATVSVSGARAAAALAAQAAEQARAEVASLQKQLAEMEEAHRALHARLTAADALANERKAEIDQLKDESDDLNERREVESRRQAEAPENINTIVSQSPGMQVQSGEEFNLPDFMWSCDNTEIMSFVKKLMAENAALKKEVSSNSDDRGSPTPPPPLDSGNAPPFMRVKLDFDINANDATADDVIALAKSVTTDSDSHQIRPLVNLLEQFLGDVKVCGAVCVALEILTFEDTENRRNIMNLGGVQSILDALRYHLEEKSEALRPCMDALWNIALDDEAAEFISRQGGVERVLEVMRKHEACADLQISGSAMMLNLALQECNHWKIVQGGGIGLITKAMERHSTSGEMLEQGCQALYMLANQPNLRPHVMSGKGCDAAKIATGCKSGCGGASRWGRRLLEVLEM